VADGGACAQAGPPVTLTPFVADPWFNAPALHGDSDGCSVSMPDGGGPVQVHNLHTLGPRLSYPAGDVGSFTVSDGRDPQAPTPVRSPPVQFDLELSCDFTASPGGTRVVRVPLTLFGTVE
jgi:hypothetical protein